MRKLYYSISAVVLVFAAIILYYAAPIQGPDVEFRDTVFTMNVITLALYAFVAFLVVGYTGQLLWRRLKSWAKRRSSADSNGDGGP